MAVLELQGVVEVQPQFEDGLHNLHIGLLCRPSSPETYTFTIGYHELMGTKLPLKKPLLVLKKTKRSEDGSDDDACAAGVELEVIGIIRHRILFKTRPMALISSTLFYLFLPYYFWNFGLWGLNLMEFSHWPLFFPFVLQRTPTSSEEKRASSFYTKCPGKLKQFQPYQKVTESKQMY